MAPLKIGVAAALLQLADALCVLETLLVGEHIRDPSTCANAFAVRIFSV